MRILILTRHFPPIVSGGARRPYLLALGLYRLGADVTILAPSRPENLPAGIEYIQTPHPQQEPVAAKQKNSGDNLKNWLRANMMLPDPDLRWSLRSIGLAKRNVSKKPDWIFSTSPPESIHLAAQLLAREYDCRWAADFRDNWLIDPLIPERNLWLRRRVEAQLAKRILKRADIICAPTRRILAEIEKYADHAMPLIIDQPGRFKPSCSEKVPTVKDDTFTIVHTGSFSLSHDMRPIKPALEFFAAARKIEPRLALKLVGRLTDAEITAARGEPSVEIAGIFSLEESWRAQTEADILLLVAASNSEIVPGKLTEYQAAGKPIICVGGGDWAIEVMGGAVDPLSALRSILNPEMRKAIVHQQSGRTVYAEDAAAKLLEAMATFGERNATNP